MPKTKITNEHREAAEVTRVKLKAAGFDFTRSEVLMAMFISVAVETTVTLQTGPAGQSLDTDGAKSISKTDASSLVRCCYIARAVKRARAPGASMERQANAIAVGLVEMFSIPDVEGLAGYSDSSGGASDDSSSPPA